MRPLLYVALAVALLLEPTLSGPLALLGGRPLLMLSVVVYYAWMNGPLAGTLFGLGLGLVADLLSIHNPGLNMLGFSLVGAIVGRTEESVYKDHGWVQALVLFLAALLHETIGYALVTRLDLSGYPIYALRYILPTAGLTAAAFPLFIALWERLFGREISFDAQRVVGRRR